MKILVSVGGVSNLWDVVIATKVVKKHTIKGGPFLGSP
ncbi:hypothetical protein VISI1226_02400 [Vibrio sinaloensis DSM 21326]|uniref:Uncharacterized protein n=1 Tax=Vibrio sinaloensis DSM 21326 TaxID=945550 RepID=E8M1T4_PHOS4|nr:hypothetical protein VISI1226_02400 [Vibrio sinaloensis DSM 21326]